MLQQVTFALGLLVTIIFGTIGLAMQPGTRPVGARAAQRSTAPPPADSPTRGVARPPTVITPPNETLKLTTPAVPRR